MKKNALITYIFFLIFCVASIYAQTLNFNRNEVEKFIADGKYDDALKMTENLLTSYYSENVTTDRLPNDFITIGSAEEAIDLNKMFRDRKNSLFMIREDDDLYFLHFSAGICYRGKKDTSRALNNFYQALRYQKIENQKSDRIFYEIGRTFLENGDMKAYYDSLETAYTLNPQKYEYSLELGKALYRTKYIKKSIFHLERYLESESGKTDDLQIYIMLANQYEQTGRYLDTLKYYAAYLNKKDNDPYIWYAYGCVAYRNTGNYEIALESFDHAIKLLPSDEIYKRSKSYEYTGDIFLKNLKFGKAISAYTETIQYQNIIKEKLNSKSSEIKALEKEISRLKISLLNNKDYVVYNEYQFQLTERDRLQREKDGLEYEFSRLNSGKIAYNTAYCYEKDEQLSKAIDHYRMCIEYDYKSNECRNRIIKLQLKIKRGY